MRSSPCEVAVLNGFRAHADQRELLEFAEAVRGARASSPRTRVGRQWPAREIEGGARIDFVAADPATTESLRAKLRERADAMTRLQCERASRPSDYAP